MNVATCPGYHSIDLSALAGKGSLGVGGSILDVTDDFDRSTHQS